MENWHKYSRRNLHRSYDFRRRKRLTFHFSTPQFICMIALIFVLFNSPFGYYIADFNVGSEGDSQINILKSILNDFSKVKFGETVEIATFPINSTYYYLMLFSITLAILLFFISALGISIIGREGNQMIGIIAGILTLIYAGLNYLIVSEINSQIGIIQAFAGVSFGIAGWTSLIVGIIYLIWFRE